MHKAISILVVAAAASAWALAGWRASTKSERGAIDADGGERAVRAELHGLKGDVLGGNQPPTRGDRIVGQVVHPRDEDFEYTPREVCLRMKLQDPEKNAKLDCSRKEYDSPHDWNDQ